MIQIAFDAYPPNHPVFILLSAQDDIFYIRSIIRYKRKLSFFRDAGTKRQLLYFYSGFSDFRNVPGDIPHSRLNCRAKCS